MRLGTMLRDIWPSFFHKPITRRYPFERVEAPTCFRGKLHWDPVRCTGCGMCSMDCPARAIEILALNRKAKRFVMRYHVDRYVYCGQCVRNCRFKCLTMNPTEWELAALRPDEFTEYSGKPDDVEKARGMARESQVAQGH